MTWNPLLTPFDFASLRRVYDAGAASPADVIEAALQRVAAARRSDVWISLAPRASLLEAARRVTKLGREQQPLFGLPFAVKDNIDVAGLPTTAACPDYAYTPERSAECVERLQAAGAIVIGKTNLDQFATGLSGARSPYGPCGSAFDAAMVAGGSSSGSAVAVALHQVAFALGTDTGGSGRVPSSFNNVVGLKPTRGVLSTRGLVPNCRTLDCVSVFAATVDDAWAVYAIIAGKDPADPYSRPTVLGRLGPSPPHPRIGIPRPKDLHFFGDRAMRAAWRASLEIMQVQGAAFVDLDLTPFFATADLLYEGPWLAERYAAVRPFLAKHAGEGGTASRHALDRAVEIYRKLGNRLGLGLSLAGLGRVLAFAGRFDEAEAAAAAEALAPR
jgi:allophanate hydrolase